MSELDFVKTMQLLSDSELMLDEDRLAQIVGGAKTNSRSAGNTDDVPRVIDPFTISDCKNKPQVVK